MTEESYIYILANDTQSSLYIGSTNNLIKRVFEHKEGNKNASNPNKLVYYEVLTDISQAILREKQLKSTTIEKKIELITRFNPNWYDLYYTISK